MDRERTHWDGCWQERTHHDCALARIAALEAAEAMLQAGRDVMAVIHGDGGHYREAHGDRKAADDAISIVYKLRAALAAEHERRKDAEGLLDAAGLFLPDSKSQLVRNVEANIKSHFARYKD